ncbi:MAG TPA: hypothetical protein VKG92_03465 [Flavobacteriales bacterium]|nr:hypothetical protein [Flavobacteriales bacterium]
MRIGLDDNSRDALHFVVLAAGVLLLLRLLVAGAGMLIEPMRTTDLPAIIASFRNGFLLNDPNVLVTGGMELPGRLAVAGVLAVLAGAGAAFLFAGVARLFGRGVRRAALFGGRAGLLLVLLWGIYAALFLPPRSVQVTADGMSVIHRAALFDGVSLPWPRTERKIDRQSITTIEHRTIASSMPGCGTQEQVVVVTGSGECVIADLTPHGTDCATSQHQAIEQATRLSEVLRSANDR